jgi:hypothetical protein
MMEGTVMTNRSILAVSTVACLVLLLVTCVAETQRQSPVPSPGDEEAIRKFLQDLLPYPMDEEQPTRYFDAFIDLNGDGRQEVVIYIRGPQHCRTSGCSIIILTPRGESYTDVGYVQGYLPVRALDKWSYGWRSLGIRVRRDGEPARLVDATVEFDSGTYSTRPETLSEQIPGEVIIPDYTFGNGDRPLFPDGQPARTNVELPREILQELLGEFKHDMASDDREYQYDADSFVAEPLDLNLDGKSELSIYLRDSCSPTGNCLIWIYQIQENRHALLLKAAHVQRIEPQTTFTNGYLDIMASMHLSAYDSFLTLYKFDGRTYRREACFDRSYRVLDEQGNSRILDEPKVTQIQCR